MLKDANVALAGRENVRGAGLNDLKHVDLVHMSVAMLGERVMVVMLDAASPHFTFGD